MVSYADGADNSKVFFVVFLVGALVCVKAMRGRERGFGLLSSVVFCGVGAVARICQLCKLLAQTTPMASFE